MTDIITVHTTEQHYPGMEHDEWRAPNGDHQYRGSGHVPVGSTVLTWSPCDVCQADHDDPTHGQPWRTCSYCGSIHPADLLTLDPDTLRPEWADWKYGWPHKLYVDLPRHQRAKFYSRHLADHPDLIDAFNDRFRALGIHWHIHPDKGLGYAAGPPAPHA